MPSHLSSYSHPDFEKALRPDAQVWLMRVGYETLRSFGGGSMRRSLSGKADHELFAELRQEIFGGKPLSGNSADLLREACGIRDDETEGWA